MALQQSTIEQEQKSTNNYLAADPYECRTDKRCRRKKFFVLFWGQPNFLDEASFGPRSPTKITRNLAPLATLSVARFESVISLSRSNERATLEPEYTLFIIVFLSSLSKLSEQSNLWGSCPHLVPKIFFFFCKTITGSRHCAHYQIDSSQQVLYIREVIILLRARWVSLTLPSFLSQAR